RKILIFALPGRIIRVFKRGNYKMTTYNKFRKKRFRCFFVLVTAIVLTVPYVAFGAGPAFSRSGSSTASGMHGQPSFSDRFHRFGFFDGDGIDDQGEQQVIFIQPSQPAPTTDPSAT